MTHVTPTWQALADCFGVRTIYQNDRREDVHVSLDTVRSVLRGLGVDATTETHAKEALKHRRVAVAERGLEAVVVSWDGGPARFSLTLPTGSTAQVAHCTVQLENGETRKHDLKLSDAEHSDWLRVSPLNSVEHWGEFTTRYPVLPGELPVGYHRLTVEAGGHEFHATLISAPSRSYAPEKQLRDWGVFIPLYSVRSEGNWGAGDYSDLERLAQWAGEQGASFTGTLPILPNYLDQPFDPSPYSPLSRVFWNEFYIDVTRLPDLAAAPEAQQLLASDEFRKEVQALRGTDLIEYRGIMQAKCKVLMAVSNAILAAEGPRYRELLEWSEADPIRHDYAQFRAATEHFGTAWPQWGEAQRGGRLTEADYDRHVWFYYLYAQHAALSQVEAVGKTADAAGSGLYLDLPIGVRPDAFDVWRDPRSFVASCYAGAPPDSVFTKGQNWGFAPLDPFGIRESGYAHVREFLHHHMGPAKWLRLDHGMSLHRLYWIPQELGAAHGAYVNYFHDDYYAVMSLESHRHETVVIGENLGTVPAEVYEGMERHELRQMFVVEYELLGYHENVLRPVVEKALASLNTHDMPPFAAWWAGDDIADRHDLGLMNDEQRDAEQRERIVLRDRIAKWLHDKGDLATADPDEAAVAAVIDGLQKFLAESSAEALLVSLEDMWEEVLSQNVPGTWQERPNWKRRARRTLEEFTADAGIRERLGRIDAARKSG